MAAAMSFLQGHPALTTVPSVSSKLSRALLVPFWAFGLAGVACGESEVEGPSEALEPLVVNATRDSSERPQLPSPSTTDILSAEMIGAMQAVTVRDAITLIPNVAVSQAESARASSFSVRGAHEISFHEFTGGRTGVGFYLDDIPCTDAYGRDLTLFDVERLAFFKGPHGTSMGLPHSMGVIDVTTRPPGPEMRGLLSTIYGSHNFRQAKAHLSGPVRDGLFFGLDGLSSRHDGWFRDRLSGRSYGKQELDSGRMRLRWLPTEQMEIDFTLGVSRHNDDPPVYVPSDRTIDPYVLATAPDAYAVGGQDYQALRAIWKGDGWQLMSVTSHRESEFDDSDDALLLELFNPFSLQRQRQQDLSTWTQEIRAESSDPEADFRWRAGLFISRRDSLLRHFMLGQGPWEGGNSIRYRMDDYAFYGELTQAVGDHLELSSGLRLQTTRDRTNSDFIPTAFAESLGGTYLVTDANGRFNGVLPMAAASWKWEEFSRTYLRLSTGMQPGGYAIAAPGSLDYGTERSLHYELGHQASCFDGGLQLRASLFHIDYRDYQSFQFNPFGETIYNARRAHATGAEGEIRVRPFEGLEIHASAGYTRAHFDEFETTVGNFSGRRMNNSPLSTVHVGAEYRAAWGGLARVDWSHVGDIWFDQGNSVKQESYSLLHARLGYEQEDFGVYLFARNMLDRAYYTHSYLFRGVPAATPGMPRSVGIEFEARF